MRVLVTGHLGYIGTVMVPMLFCRLSRFLKVVQRLRHTSVVNWAEIGLACGYFDQSHLTRDFREFAGGIFALVPYIRKDVRDAIRDYFKGIDAVIHLAALSNDPLGNLNPDITYAINHRGSVHIAKLAKEAGVKRFLLSSSCSNYGRAGD